MLANAGVGGQDHCDFQRGLIALESRVMPLEQPQIWNRLSSTCAVNHEEQFARITEEDAEMFRQARLGADAHCAQT
jgi:hypothetical protein